jgi:MurNAc alpha-1-phosphate uridylyltransferase
MLLSAGRGTRLRPLTDHTPKPLLEVAGETLIERHLRRLAAAGIAEVVVNLHHLGEQIEARVGDGARLGLRVHHLWEPELLETGGGIQAALDRLGPDPFIVVSADLWTDYPLAALRAPLPEGRLARLVLVRSHLGQDFGFARTPPPGEIADLVPGPAESFTYASLGLYSPALFDGAPGGAYPLRDLLFPALRAGRLCGEVYAGAWFNIGSLRELEDVRAAIEAPG